MEARGGGAKDAASVVDTGPVRGPANLWYRDGSGDIRVLGLEGAESRSSTTGEASSLDSWPGPGATPDTGGGFVRGQVAQLVEQRTENPRVGGSIPSLAT